MTETIDTNPSIIDGYLPQIRLTGEMGCSGEPYPWKVWDKHTHVWYRKLTIEDQAALKRGKRFLVYSFMFVEEEVRLIKHYPKIEPCRICGERPYVDPIGPMDREIKHTCVTELTLSIRRIDSAIVLIDAWNKHNL